MKTTKLLRRSGNQYDTIKLIKKVTRRPDPIVLDLALKLKKKYPGNITKQLKAGFDFIFDNTRFIKDPDHTQQIRLPKRFLKDGRGNCVDYSVFFVSLCRALNVPCALKMVSFADNKNYAHIYAVTMTQPPIFLDAVIGQDQNGKEIDKRNTERRSFFNKETPYINGYLLKI